METKIKNEFGNNFISTHSTLLCHTCLSADRKLSPLGQYKIIFEQLMASHYPYYQLESTKPYEEMLVCWECLTHLRKMRSFLHKARQAELVLQLVQGNVIQMNKSFSTLGHTLITDYYETVYSSDCPSELHQPEGGDVKNDFADDNILLILEPTETNLLEEDITKREVLKKKPKNYDTWTKRRMSENRKTKFKSVGILKYHDRYQRVRISHEQLISLLENAKRDDMYVNVNHKCDKCVLSFDSEESYISHWDSHHKKILGKYVCDICETRFPNKNLLEKHCRNHYYVYVCRLCSNTSFRMKHFQYHWRHKHKNEVQCIKCGLSFWSRNEFYKHHKESHERFECDHCGITFKMKYCIIQHIRKQHSPLECKICDKRFSRYNGLWLHKKLKHPKRKLETAYCVECNKHFENVYSYKWHLNNSVRHKPRKKISIPCPSCEKIFSKNIYMKDHYDLVHLKKIKYRCEQCDKNFVRNADLVKHTRRLHEGIKTPKNKVCYACGRGFSSNKILENHIRTHTGERPFQCPQCPAKFAQKVAMTGHQRNVHKDPTNKSLKSQKILVFERGP